MRFLSLILLSFLTGSMDLSAKERPNVLMISIDDLNDWTGFLGGHPQVKTPHMDKLANSGRLFANAHCAVPVCSSSRVSVMSGLAATTHGSYEIGPSYQSIPALKDVVTIQRHFKNQGYYTLSGGKVLHHGFGGPVASDIDRSLIKGHSGPKPKQPLNLPKGWSRHWDWGHHPLTDADAQDMKLAHNAAAALKEDFDKPFFMSVGFYRPHVPLLVPPKWFELYDEESIVLAPSPKSDLDDVPKNFQTINDYAVAPTHADVLASNSDRKLTHAYLASISFVDACVGIVMDALKDSKYAENTIVVLWSDHGFHMGEKQHWAKRTLWEESTRVPLLVYGPGIEPGKACVEPASLIDIYPTLIELCGLGAPHKLDGISLLPQLKDPLSEREQPAIISSYYGNHAVRTRDWRLISYEDGAEELYDHRNDPNEYKNLINDPKYKAIRDELAQWLPKEAVAEVKKVSERHKRKKAHKDKKRSKE